jgi:hypothetical protein
MSQTTADPTLPPPPPEAQQEPRRPARRRWLVPVAIAVAVLLVAGVGWVVLSRGDTAEAQPLALSFIQGQEQTYEIHMTMDAHMSSDVFGDQPLKMDLGETVTWRVKSVDQDGTATIEVTVTDVSGSLNGEPVPPTDIPPLEMTIASDGRVLSAGGIAFGGSPDTQGFGFPGMEQLTPILPDPGEKVSVGDTWEKTFSQDFPYGDGTVEFTASSTYERNETVDGREAAVIQTKMTVPLDLTIDLSELLKALGPELTGTTGADLGSLQGASIAYDGRGQLSQTSVVDLQAKELLKTRSNGDFDISLGFKGIPGIGDAPVDIAFTGTFTQSLDVR